jgi:phosphocarrier protein HPr
VRKGDQEVDGKSIMGLMMLAAEEGSTLMVIASGSDEQEMLSALEKLFLDRFGEKD